MTDISNNFYADKICGYRSNIPFPPEPLDYIDKETYNKILKGFQKEFQQDKDEQNN